MYDQIKSQLHDAGELRVQMPDGRTFELHLHNSSFDDEHRLIEIDAGISTYWLRGDEAIYSWVNRRTS